MTTSPLVPAVLPFAIDGHEYLIDSNYERETVQVIRQQADTSSEPGEQSLSPLGLWRRSQESWHHGAGQDFLDGRTEEAADPHRFRSSKGIDVWTRGQISLLHPTTKIWNTTGTNLHLAVAATLGAQFVLYVADGTEVYWATGPFGGINSLALGRGTGWTATNATVATYDVTRFTLTATSAAAVSITSPAGTGGVPVDPNRSYVAVVDTSYVSGGAGRLPTLVVNWYTSAGTLISSTAAVTGTNDTSIGRATTTATAPSTAAYAGLTVSWSTNFANGEIHSIEGAQIAPADTSGAVVPDNFKTTAINAGQPAQTVQSIATDGSHLWAAMGTSGLHRNTAFTETSMSDVPAAPGAGQIHLVGWANGFLLAAGSTTSTTGKNTLWLVNDPLGTPTLGVAPSFLPIKTHPNPSFEWTGIGSGRNCVYAWGNSGGNGEVYKILYDPNTGTLATAASPATALPDGETIHSLYFYAGGIIMGTGRGVRLGQADGAGNIDYGPLVETDWPVRCLEPQGRWCWFGWTKYDAAQSGLGRIDLGYLTDTLTPAWASDLMPPYNTIATGDVVGCVTFAPYGYTASQREPVRVFSIAGDGIYAEDPMSRATTGELLTGAIRYSTSEPKQARTLDFRHHALPADVSVVPGIQPDGSGTWTQYGWPNPVGGYGPTPVTITDLGGNPVIFEALELRLRFNRLTQTTTDYTNSPEVTRWTLKSLPLPSTIDETFTVRIHMKSTVETASGSEHPIDVPGEISFLKGLERSRAIVQMQLGEEVHDVFVVASKFVGEHWYSPKREFAEGMLELQMQTARG